MQKTDKSSDKAEKKEQIKLLAQNKKAFHDYEVLERLKQGLCFWRRGQILRQGGISIVDTYATSDGNEMVCSSHAYCTVSNRRFCRG